MLIDFLFSTLFSQPPFPEKPLFSRKPVAEIIEQRGEVKVRFGHRTDWTPLVKTNKLFPGDRIFTAQGSYVKIRYKNEESTFVKVGELTVFEVFSFAPVASHLLKSVPSVDGHFIKPNDASKVAWLPFSDFENNVGQDFVGKGKSIADDAIENIAVEYPIKKIKATFPKSNLYLSAPLKDKSVLVSLPNTDKMPILYGTLWQLEPSKRPLWSIVVKNSQLEVPLSKPGVYVFSASSENGRFRIAPIGIKIAQKQETLVPASVRPNDLVVLP